MTGILPILPLSTKRMIELMHQTTGPSRLLQFVVK